EQVVQGCQLALSMQPLGQGAVGCDADRLALGCVVDPIRILVPVGFAEAQPVELAASCAEAIEVLERPLCVAVLPGVDACLLGALEQLHHPLGGMPSRLVLAEQPVEMGIAVHWVTTKDEPGNFVWSEPDCRQQQRFRRRLPSSSQCRQRCCESGGPLEKISTAGAEPHSG